MSVVVPPHTEATIERLVASGQFADASQVIDAAVRLLDEHQASLVRLRAELAVGEDQERRGELTELTPDRFAQLKRRATANSAAGRPVKDAVRP
jgi:putative addiction module CopG family antidote